MPKSLNFKDKISGLPPVIKNIIAQLPHSFTLYATGGYARDILLNEIPETIELLLTGPESPPAECFPVETKTVQNENSVIFTFAFLEFPIQVVFHKSGTDQPALTVKKRTEQLRDDIAKEQLTSRLLLIGLNGKSAGKLFDPYGVYPLLQERRLATLSAPPDAFRDDPALMIAVVYECALRHFVIDQELETTIAADAGLAKTFDRAALTGFLLAVLRLPEPGDALVQLFRLGLLESVFPEAVKLAGVEQMKEYNHKDVFYHTCAVLDNIAPATGNIWLRFAALVHDIAKPRTKRFVEGTGWTFHGHEEMGARMMKSIFQRLALPTDALEYVTKLVRLHLRPAALVSEGVSDSAIRRLITEAGSDLEDLLTLCRADITSKNPAKVNKVLNNYEHVAARILEVKEKDALAAFQSPVRGEEIMKICNIPPSKTVGRIKTAIEEAILKNEIENTYEAAYAYMLEIKDRFL